MGFIAKLLLPAAIKALKAYAIKFLEEKFPNESDLIHEIADWLNGHISTGAAPSANLSSAASHFSDLETIHVP